VPSHLIQDMVGGFTAISGAMVAGWCFSGFGFASLLCHCACLQPTRLQRSGAATLEHFSRDAAANACVTADAVASNTARRLRKRRASAPRTALPAHLWRIPLAQFFLRQTAYGNGTRVSRKMGGGGVMGDNGGAHRKRANISNVGGVRGIRLAHRAGALASYESRSMLASAFAAAAAAHQLSGILAPVGTDRVSRSCELFGMVFGRMMCVAGDVAEPGATVLDGKFAGL